MDFEEEYIKYIESLLESEEDRQSKQLIAKIGKTFISLLEAKGGNYNKFWTMHVGEGYGEHKFGDRIRAGGKKAEMLKEFQLKLVDPNSPENKKMERKVISDFIREYGIRVEPEYHPDGRLKDAVFKDTLYINDDGEIYAKTPDGKVLPIGPEQMANPPHQRGEELYIEAGEPLSDEIMEKYVEMRNDAIEARMSWYNEKAAFYQNQARFGDEYSEDEGPESAYERSLVGDNAQPLAINKEMGTEFKKQTGGSSEGTGRVPTTKEKTEKNTSVGLGNALLDEAETMGEILDAFPELENADMRKIINSVQSGRLSDTVIVKTINDARKYLYKLSGLMSVESIKDTVQKLKDESASKEDIPKEVGKILSVINTFYSLDNGFKRNGTGGFGVNSAQATLKKLLAPIEMYKDADLYKNQRNIDAVKNNLLAFIDNFIGNGEMKDGKFADDSALVPKFYNLLTDISKGALADG